MKNIDFSYPDGRRVFSDLNLIFRDGQKAGLAGLNGCGKTTLLSVIMGLLYPQRGEVEIFGRARREEKDFKEIRAQMGFVFQDANDQLFCPTVADDIAFGPLNLGASRKEADLIVEKTLALLRLEGFGPRVTYDLSGGEKKLVSIGTALALNPRLLILDEPTTSLDEKTVARLEQILNDCGLPYIIASHDRSFLARTTHLVWTMTEGRLVEG
ncbi:MAG: energy-coupling factor ABC transporter ATP-binding protein [Candidatus Adiutrix sp.]|nr:energy-coupling factor ABC transporter ATP-binding protein [Candidatus Adiutrix sp.]